MLTATRSQATRRNSSYLRLLPLFPRLTWLLLGLPVLGGLLGVVLPAFGYFPDLGGDHLHLGHFWSLLAHPAVPGAVGLTLWTGLAATAISLALALLLAAAGHRTRWFQKLEHSLVPLLAVPHAAVALGLAFLIAPSGWFVRLLSPGLTGWDLPPEFVTVQDSWGLSLILGLVLKETPYLLLMTLAALPQVRASVMVRAGQALGYASVAAWWRLVLPQLYPLLRLPVFAVLAFSLSVVDVSLILGPTTPPPLAVLILQWVNEPDLEFRFLAATGAVLLLNLTLVALAGMWLLERLVFHRFRGWMTSGRRKPAPFLKTAGRLASWLLPGLSGAGLLGLLLWSLTRRWPYPQSSPETWTLRHWLRHGPALADTVGTTLLIAGGSTLIALVLVVGCLENEQWRQVRMTPRSLWLLYLPLILPQAAFLFGVQVLAVKLRIDGTFAVVIWSHLLFVLPYCFLSLAESWRRLDSRFLTTARCLGHSPWQVLLRVRMPLLLRPLLVAAAIGIAVSVALYLPTLFAGAGRVATLTTEAVAHAAGADRRVIGVYGFLQALVPWLGLLFALLVPRLLFRNRQGMQG